MWRNIQRQGVEGEGEKPGAQQRVRRTFGMDTSHQRSSEESSSQSWLLLGEHEGGCPCKPGLMARLLVPKWVGAAHKANLSCTGQYQELLARQSASPSPAQRSHGRGGVSLASLVLPAGLRALGKGARALSTPPPGAVHKEC